MSRNNSILFIGISIFIVVIAVLVNVVIFGLVHVGVNKWFVCICSLVVAGILIVNEIRVIKKIR